MWHLKEVEIQLRIPDIYLGTKKKGVYSDKTRILHKNPTEDEITEFYKSKLLTWTMSSQEYLPFLT